MKTKQIREGEIVSYYDDARPYFDDAGLGKGPWLGWALCDGRDGRPILEGCAMKFVEKSKGKPDDT